MKIGELISSIIGLISPHACAICGSRISSTEKVFCTKCNLEIPRTSHIESLYENEMAQTFWLRLPIEKCVALAHYEGGSPISELIYKIKYGGLPHLAQSMGEVLYDEFCNSTFFDDIDAILPIPVYPKRLKQRGYNQSLKLAQGISRCAGIPIIDKTIIRATDTSTQTTKDRWQRSNNLKNAFRLLSPKRLEGKHLLIVDDVITTGATIISLTDSFKHLRDIKISVLAIGFASSVK